MFSRKEQQRSAATSLLGALAWAVLAALAGARRAPFGVIELLFLFAVLVIVPLGLALIGQLRPPAPFRLDAAGRSLQPLAVLSAVASLWLPPGRSAGTLALPWLALATLLALTGALALRQSHGRSWTSFMATLAGFDLALAAAWFVTSRLGLRPLGFQEPIIFLTAMHFHYAGFATVLIAAGMVCVAERHPTGARILRPVTVLVMALPFTVAIGFTFSARLRMVAALAFAATVATLAVLQLGSARTVHNRSARTFLQLASGAVFMGMLLTCWYAVGEWTGNNRLTVPAMASTHGVLNGLGFALLSLLGWLAEFHSHNSLEVSYENRDHRRDGVRRTSSGASAAARGSRGDAADPGRRPPRPDYPEFVAREFYDR